jgi:hypothetical protein
MVINFNCALRKAIADQRLAITSGGIENIIIRRDQT